MTGSIKLSDNPGDMVRVACERCGRSGRYRKEKLVAQYGPDIALPDLRHEIAKRERRGEMHDACGVHYVGLVGKTILVPNKLSCVSYLTLGRFRL
jgi:hypothetical protein